MHKKISYVNKKANIAIVRACEKIQASEINLLQIQGEKLHKETTE